MSISSMAKEKKKGEVASSLYGVDVTKKLVKVAKANMMLATTVTAASFTTTACPTSKLSGAFFGTGRRGQASFYSDESPFWRRA